MTELRLAHLAWSKAHGGRHRFDLADSAVAAPDLEALGLPCRAGLPREGYALLAELERALGTRLGAPGARVLVTAGASEANAAAMGALLVAGDEALVEAPGYEPLREVPRLFGARVRTFPRPSGRGLAAAVARALSPLTRLVVLTDLHNPGGAALEEEEALALTALAEERGVWLLCDETFRDASDRPPATVAAMSPRWIATSSLTKAYGLGGLRIGWIATGPEALERCATAQNALSVLPSLPSVTLALELVPHLDALHARARRILVANHAGWAEFLRAHPPAAPAPQPAGTTTWYALGEGAPGDAFADFAAERFDLAVAPGRFFGDPRGVRIALGGEPERFAAALDTLEQALAAFAAGARG